MADRTRIFICYKKKGSDGRENNSANQLYQYLVEVPDYEVWMDDSLESGLPWEKTIYEHLISSHIMILAVGEGTSQSEWVRRELSVAMAFGIQIVPVGLTITEDQLHKELKELGLTGIHYRRPFNMDSQTARAIVTKLEPAIRKGREGTELGGYDLLKRITKKVETRPPSARPNLSVKGRECTFGSKTISLHIAAGDIFQLDSYDILVNSENDFMQMARIFDMATFSSNIRHLGSSRDKGYLEDTIQLEIEKLIAGKPRPVPAATTISTSSGGPSSTLYESNKVSHIIHVAAVHALVGAEVGAQRIVPLSGRNEIRNCVTAALAATQAICKAKGVISPEGTRQRELQEETAAEFAPRRLVLPLFGTGRGGQSPAEVGPIVLEAILGFFSSPRFQEQYMPISDIHLSAYYQEDVDVMVDKLSRLEVRH